MARSSKVGEVPKVIQNLITEFIKPKTVSHECCKFQTKEEWENVNTVVISNREIDGAHLLLKILTKKKNWFSPLLEILHNPNVKLQHIADMMEEERRAFKNAQSSQYAGQNLSIGAPASCICYTYNNAMEKNMSDIFVSCVVPENVIHPFNKYNYNKILKMKDIQNVHADVSNHSKDVGALLLLERLVFYEDWINMLLEVLNDQKINMNQVAEKIENATQIIHVGEATSQDHQNINNNLRTTERHLLTRESDERNDSSEATAFTDATLFGNTEPLISPTMEIDINNPDSEGSVSLKHADANNQIECVKQFIDSQCDVHIYGKDGNTALILSALNGHSECVKLLIDSHCYINLCNNNGDTALILAAWKGHSECVKLLIDSQCDVNMYNKDGNTALMWAASNGHSECVKLLIDSCCDINLCNNNGQNALTMSAENGRAECVKLLIESYCDVNMFNNNSQTALILAAHNGHSKCVKMLIDGHCDVNMCTKKRNTALMWAAQNGHSECVKLLIKSHCDINMCNNNGDTALILAAWKGHIECVKLLIDSHCDVNMYSSIGNTALIFAAQNGHSECVKLLIDSQCDINLCNNNGQTALIMAAENGYSKCVKLLISSHCDVNMCTKNTALYQLL